MTPPPANFWAANLQPGATCRVTLAFTDADQVLHPAGETWLFQRASFDPRANSLILTVEQRGQPRQIRLLWNPEAQAAVIDAFSQHVELVSAAPAAAPAASSGSGPRRVWFGLGLLAILCLCLAGLAALGNYYLGITRAASPTPVVLTYSVDAPVMLKVGQDFDLTLTVTNPGPQPQTLDSVGLSALMSQAAAVRGVEPPFSSSSPAADPAGYSSYTYASVIPAGGSRKIVFHLAALKSNSYLGQVRFCTSADPAPKCSVVGFTLTIQ